MNVDTVREVGDGLMDHMRFTMAGREAGREELGARRAERLRRLTILGGILGFDTVFAVGACLGFSLAGDEDLNVGDFSEARGAAITAKPPSFFPFAVEAES